MKHVKKLVSLLLALVMVMGLAITASAAQEGTLTGGSITIKNANKDDIYRAYQILYLESYNAEKKTYSYKANSQWKEWLETQSDYVAIDDQGYVTWKDSADAAAFAKLAKAQIKSANIEEDASAEAESTEVEITGLKLGYYLVDTTLGTLCSLDTTKPNVEMQEKNGVPTNAKEVQEDSTGDWGKTNDADIGQTVYYRSTITAQAGAENYVFHDTMSAGLTYTGVTGITLNKNELDADNYTVKTSGLSDGCTFEVVFTQDFCDTLKANDKIVISYTAEVNENAVIGLPGNPNDCKLSYGEKNNTKYTPVSETITYTWDMEVLKYGNGNEANPLEGVTFKILNNDKSQAAKVVNGKIAEWVSVDAGTILTTDANGKIKVEGLDSDTYYLREVETLAGYNKLSGDVAFEITGATEGESDKLTYTTVVVKVNNQSGTELPSTGGMGTTIFYVIGGILVLGAAVLLVTRKRMNA